MTTRARVGWLVALAVLVVAIVVPAVLPTTFDDYRSVAERSAQQALAQVRSVREAVRADLDGDTLDPYVSALLWQARDRLSTAQSDLASEEVPDEQAAQLHREVVPLLADAVREVNAAGAAVDTGDDAMRASERALGELGDRLEAFVERHR
jgi:flagellar motor protein MotB